MSHSRTATTNTSGSVVTSDDPNTNPNASTAKELAGDINGVAKGDAGTAQAAIGTAT